IGDLQTPTESDYRSQLGEEIGERMGFIVDSIESLVLPRDPKAAFELLVAVFEADAVAMENCGDHHFSVECTFKRAAAMMAEAAKTLPRSEVVAAVEVLVADD